jgi:phage terminase small subunit
MAIRGRKPTPSHLKLVRGNPGRRPINHSEPKPALGPIKPASLRGRASRLWDDYAPQLERLGILTVLDGAMFALWCELAAEAERKGPKMVAAKIAQLRALASSFGLDPSTRSRMSAGGDPPGGGDELSKFLRQHPDDPGEVFFAKRGR